MLRTVQLSRRDVMDLLRSVGGLLVAAGAVLVLARKSGHHEWGGFARLLVVLVPAVVLYVLALGAPERSRGEDARPWQSVLMITAILLVPVALLEFLQWVGANTQHSLYGAVVFATTALLAGYAVRQARVAYAALLAGLAMLVAWLEVWEQILGHPSTGTSRWLLVIAAVLLFAGAAGLARAKAIGARELATAGGIAAVSAGVLGVIVGAFVGVFRSVTTLGRSSGGVISSSSAAAGLPERLHRARLARPAHLASPFATNVSGLQHFGWDLYLLVVSLGLVWVGARVRARGLGYVGGVGLVAFLISAGVQITRLESGREPTTSLVGWPLALLVVGIVGLAAPALYRRDS
jgi:hypothetical protein